MAKRGGFPGGMPGNMNEALRKVEDEAAKAMGKLAGGLGSMGGGFPF